MPEPDSPNDEVFYGEKSWHFPNGLNIHGRLSVADDIPEMIAGEYLPLSSSTYSTLLLISNRLYYLPFDISNDQPFDRLSYEVTVVGTAGSVLRGGLYADNGTGRRPGNLIVEETLVGTSLGFKEFTIDLDTPGRYWAAIVGQGAPATQPTLRTVVMSSVRIPLPAGPNANINSFIVKDGISGALPPVADGASVASTSAMPYAILRAA